MRGLLQNITRASWWPMGLMVAAGLTVSDDGNSSPERGARSHQAPPALSADALVRVTVAVDGVNGTPVRGLRLEDFEVISDGQARPVEYFSAAEVPVALVLLVDVSASNPIPLDDLRQAVDRALLEPRTPADRVRVGGLARELAFGPRFATDRVELRLAARLALTPRDADRFGPSPLWDGVETAVKALEPEQRRRAIVMVTDGRSTGNVHGMADVTNHAIVADVSINIIAVPTETLLPQNRTTYARVRPSVLLEQMAGATGGAYAEIREFADVTPFLLRAISRLRQVYTIGFPPVALDGRSHGLAVRVKQTGAKVRTKAGYVAGVPRQIPPR